MRRRDRGKGTGAKDSLGTPTANPPTPQAIDDYTGFKVRLDALKKDWQGLLTVDPDIRSPQDFVRGIKDNMALPYSRPEAPNEYVAGPLVWQDGETFIMTESGGDVVYSEGINPTADEL